MSVLLYSHTALTVQPQRLTHNAREYLIAPCAMIVEGVLNGGLVTGEEIQACQWNGIPVVITHPTDASGQAISANAPEVLAQYGVGQVFRTQYATATVHGAARRRAQAELWIDVDRVAQLGGEAQQSLTMLETQTPLEVSTAFFSEDEQATGSFHGTPYHRIHHHLRADHLALLPNAIGACNWRDGCGAPRINQARCGCATCEERAIMPQEPETGWRRFVAVLREFLSDEEAPVSPCPARRAAVTINGYFVADRMHQEACAMARRLPTPPLSTNQTDTDLREAIYGALAREMDTYVTPLYLDGVDATAQTFTYRCGEQLKQRGWTLDDAGVLTLLPGEQDVQRVTTYLPVGPPEPADDNPSDMGGMLMDNQAKEMTMPATAVIKRRVDALIANEGTRWTEDDRHMLEAQDEAFLIRLEAQPREMPAMVARLPETVGEAIATLPAHLQEPMAAMAQEYETRKNAAVTLLVANKQSPFSAEELQAMTAQRLEQLVAMAGIAVPHAPLVTNYAGQGFPHIRAIPEEELPPPPPNTLQLVVERQRALGKLH